MSWLIWRQHRSELLVVGIALALCGAFLTFEHLSMAASYAELGLGQCDSTATPTCMTNLQSFANRFGNLNLVIYSMLLLPALVGLFIGAPLVSREFEAGTFRFVWLQGVTRTQWYLAKVVALAVGCVVAAAGLSAIVSWALDPLVRVLGILLQPSLNPLTTPLFDLTGVALVAGTLLALSLGILAGTATRQTVLAMLVTLVLFGVIRIPLDGNRQNLAAPEVATAAVQASSGTPAPPGSWVLRTGFVNRNGQTYEMLGEAAQPCRSTFNDAAAFDLCIRDIGLRTYAEYQPPERFWRFQVIESGVQVGLALGALLVAWWIIRRRIA